MRFAAITLIAAALFGSTYAMAEEKKPLEKIPLAMKAKADASPEEIRSLLLSVCELYVQGNDKIVSVEIDEMITIPSFQGSGISVLGHCMVQK